MYPHRTSIRRFLLPVLAGALSIGACDDDEKTEPEASQPAASAVAPPPAEKAPVAQARPSPSHCRDVTPYFPYDSDAPLPEGTRGVQELGQCLSQALEAGESVTLVGRADDRGSQTYNYWLGMRRAQRVRGMLVEQGLSASQIKLKSIGERGAQGHLPEHSRAEDRRVDVVWQQSAS